MQANVVISSTDSANKKVTTTISYVNPKVANNKLLELARAINSLSLNTFTSATKETKGDVL